MTTKVLIKLPEKPELQMPNEDRLEGLLDPQNLRLVC